VGVRGQLRLEGRPAVGRGVAQEPRGRLTQGCQRDRSGLTFNLTFALPLAPPARATATAWGNFVTPFSDPSRENSQARYWCSYTAAFAWNLHSPRSVSTVSSKRSRAVAAPTLAGVLSSPEAVSEVRADGDSEIQMQPIH
jgi:hypothetical protein